MTQIRFFAAAKAAVGTSAMVVTDVATLGDAIDVVAASIAEDRRVRWDEVQAKCSYLVDGLATTDRTTAIDSAELVDVMPPFAGG